MDVSAAAILLLLYLLQRCSSDDVGGCDAEELVWGRQAALLAKAGLVWSGLDATRLNWAGLWGRKASPTKGLTFVPLCAHFDIAFPQHRVSASIWFCTHPFWSANIHMLLESHAGSIDTFCRCGCRVNMSVSVTAPLRCQRLLAQRSGNEQVVK